MPKDTQVGFEPSLLMGTLLCRIKNALKTKYWTDGFFKVWFKYVAHAWHVPFLVFTDANC